MSRPAACSPAWAKGSRCERSGAPATSRASWPARDRSIAPCSARPPSERLPGARRGPARSSRSGGADAPSERWRSARARPTAPFGAGEAAFLQAAAASLSLALENALLEEELRQVGRRALARVVPAAQPVRHQPRARGQPGRERDQGARHHGRDGPADGLALRALPARRRRARGRAGARDADGGGGPAHSAGRGRGDAPGAGRRAADRRPPGRARCASGCCVIGWRWPCRCRWARARTACWRWASARRVRRSPRRTATSRFALGRQALVALESVRLHRIRAEKERQDRELQFAREIQRSLFPVAPPGGARVRARRRQRAEPGGRRRPLRLHPAAGRPGGADRRRRVGQGHARQPAHGQRARVAARPRGHAAAGAAAWSGCRASSTTARRRTATSRSSTPSSIPPPRTLVYVNGGHVPPCLLRASGEEVRLTCGGPVLGLIEIAPDAFEVGTVELGRGDVLALVTDGVTEACSPGRGRVRRAASVRDAARGGRGGRGGDPGGDRGLRPRLDRAGGIGGRSDGRRTEGTLKRP